MTRLRRFWAWLRRHTDAVENGACVALVRIGVALSALLLLAPFLFTDDGREIVRFSFCDDGWGGYRSIVGSAKIKLLGGATEPVVRTLLGIGFAASVLMLLGAFGRLPVLALAVTTKLVFSLNSDASGGADSLLGNAVFLLLLADCTATLSLDCWVRTRRLFDHEPIAAWPRKLMLVQLTVVYTTTGVQKLVSTAWTPLDGFSALYQILQSPQWARAPGLIEASDGWLVVPAAIMSFTTIIWEVFFFVVLIAPRARAAFAIVGVGIHIGIIALMEVGVFSELSMALYPVMFAGACARLARRASGDGDERPAEPALLSTEPPPAPSDTEPSAL